jgi:tetratricopeptide (TPR) repeat protein
MGIFFVVLSLSFTSTERIIQRIIPYIVFVIVCTLGWRSYAHTIDFKNSLTLNEYDATTSPNDPRHYSDITRMSIPQNLNDEIKALQGKSQQDSNHISVSKEELWKMVDDLRSKIKSNHNDPELHHALAVACFARGLFLSSEENFFTAMQDNPRDAIIPYNLGILYYSAHVGIKAEGAWQEALRLDPTMGNAHLNLSFLYYESGQYHSAWDHCQKAIQLGITVPSSLVNEIRRKIS